MQRPSFEFFKPPSPSLHKRFAVETRQGEGGKGGGFLVSNTGVVGAPELGQTSSRFVWPCPTEIYVLVPGLKATISDRRRLARRLRALRIQPYRSRTRVRGIGASFRALVKGLFNHRRGRGCFFGFSLGIIGWILSIFGAGPLSPYEQTKFLSVSPLMFILCWLLDSFFFFFKGRRRGIRFVWIVQR